MLRPDNHCLVPKIGRRKLRARIGSGINCLVTDVGARSALCPQAGAGPECLEPVEGNGVLEGSLGGVTGGPHSRGGVGHILGSQASALGPFPEQRRAR